MRSLLEWISGEAASSPGEGLIEGCNAIGVTFFIIGLYGAVAVAHHIVTYGSVQ